MKKDYGLKYLDSKGFFILVIALLVLINLAVFFNIPILRQVLGFLFLTFLPGLLILFILKLNKLGLVEKIVLSVGLSISFSMLFGLLLSGLLPALGYTKPLSTISLLLSFSTATIILATLAYFRNRAITFSLSNLKLAAGEKAFLIVPALFPLLSIVGMRIMNLTDNNVLLMVFLFLIPAYVFFISFSHRKVSEKVYPIAILLISISLLLMYSLRSNHIIGSDIHREYFIFLTTLDNLRWSELGFGILDACLSISILPAIYQTFLNINPEYLFKLLCSLIVCNLPLVVYLISKKYIGSFYAFLASVFFMSQIIFLWTPSFVRINISIFFFSLAIMVMFHDGISELNRKALFIIFIASLVVSHYSTTYAAFFALLLTSIGMQILTSVVPHKKEKATLPAGSTALKENPPPLPSQGESPPRHDATASGAAAPEPSQTWPKKGITLFLVALFLAVLFFWYAQMTGTSFNLGVRFVYNTFTKWQWFLTEGAADQPVQAAFGKTFSYSGMPQRIELVVSWLTIIFIAIGGLTVIRRFRAMVSTPYTRQEKPIFLLKRFEAEYIMLSIMCFGLLVATVMLPYISVGYGSARTYFQMMVPLSIFFTIGGIEVARYLKARPYWVILAVLVPYFFCTTGVMCQVFGFPRAITLNSEGPLYGGYVLEVESYSAKWVSEYVERGAIYAYGPDMDRLLSQGRIPGYGARGSRIRSLEWKEKVDGYIYLGRTDITVDRIMEKSPDLFSGKSKIYTNGGAGVYR